MKSEAGATLTAGTLDARLRFYPGARSGFFLTGGLGIGSVDLELPLFGHESELGFGVVLGVGWDLRVGSNVSITPFWSGIGLAGSQFDANFGQIGIGVTIH